MWEEVEGVVWEEDVKAVALDEEVEQEDRVSSCDDVGVGGDGGDGAV